MTMTIDIDPDLARILEELLLSVRVREPWSGELLRPVQFELPYEIWQRFKDLPHREGCTSMVDDLHVRRALSIYLIIMDAIGLERAKEILTNLAKQGSESP